MLEAENQAKMAQEKLNSLQKKGGRNKIPEPIHISKELLPIAYKDKLDSPTKLTDKNQLSNIRRNTHLAVIPEEKEGYYYKLISIQSHVRGWVVRKEYILKRKAIVKIQRNIKRYLIRKLFLQIKEAITFIQQYWRYWIRNKQRRLKKMPKKSILSRK